MFITNRASSDLFGNLSLKLLLADFDRETGELTLTFLHRAKG